MRLPIILDTDPGIDDAAAIAAALFAPELDLQLMTDVPLAQGASMPLVRPLRDAASVHGESGMEGYDFVEHQRQPLAKPAFQAIRDALMHAAEPITLVAIGPLTNIALLLTQYPECVFNIRRLVIMGGSAGRGNFTPLSQRQHEQWSAHARLVRYCVAGPPGTVHSPAVLCGGGDAGDLDRRHHGGGYRRTTGPAGERPGGAGHRRRRVSALGGGGDCPGAVIYHSIFKERSNDLWTGVFERLERDL